MKEFTLQELIACCKILHKMNILELKVDQKTYDDICQKRFYQNTPDDLTEITGQIKNLRICGVCIHPPDQIAFRGEVDTSRVYDRC